MEVRLDLGGEESRRACDLGDEGSIDVVYDAEVEKGSKVGGGAMVCGIGQGGASVWRVHNILTGR